MTGTTIGRMRKVSMATPTRREKPYWFSTIVLGINRPTKEMIMISPAVLTMLPVFSTARQTARGEGARVRRRG